MCHAHGAGRPGLPQRGTGSGLRGHRRRGDPRRGQRGRSRRGATGRRRGQWLTIGVTRVTRISGDRIGQREIRRSALAGAGIRRRQRRSTRLTGAGLGACFDLSAVPLEESGLAPKDSVNWGFNEIVGGFYSGTCAFLDQDPDALISIAERMKPEDYGVAPFPKGPAGKTFPTIGYAGWSMMSASANKDLSWKLIEIGRAHV